MELHKTRIGQLIANRIEQAGREARSQLEALRRADAPAEHMAAAFTVGTLVSTVPIPVVDMALALFVMRRFQRLPRAPIFAAMALWNNLVMAPLYASTPKVGGYVLSLVASRAAVAPPEALLFRLALGYGIIVLCLTAASYLVSHTGFRQYQRRRSVSGA